MPSRLSLLLVLLLFSSLLFAAAGAHGAPAAPVASLSAAEGDFEGLEDESEEEGEEEDEFVEVECETFREEAEEGGITPAEADEFCAELTSADKSRGKRGEGKHGSTSVAPEECVLRSAHAHAVVNGAGDKLKLTIGYTAYQPAGATVEIRKGSSRIATKSLRLGRSGVLRIVKDLGKAEAPKRVVVRVAVPSSPGFCGKYETENVTVS